MAKSGPECTICASPKRLAFEQACRQTGKTRQSISAVCRDFGFSRSAVQRHLTEHVKTVLEVVESRRANADLASGLGLEMATLDLHERTLAILSEAEASKDLRVALAAIREARENLSQLGDWNGRTKAGVQINFLLDPRWLATRAALAHALQPYPEAAHAAALALEKLDGQP